MNDLHEWFQKNDLCPENILYLYRSDRKTVVHRMDGEEAALYAPLLSVLSVLPENLFLNISKGIAVCCFFFFYMYDWGRNYVFYKKIFLEKLIQKFPGLSVNCNEPGIQK